MVNRHYQTSHSEPLDALEFEFTDLGDARHALDELPAGVADPGRYTPGYWEKRRRPTLPSDRALTGETVEWAIALPPGLRPRELGSKFPRLANALAAAWGDSTRTVAALESLLVDHRGGRRGLPYEVQAELQRLLDYLKHGTLPQPVAPAASEPAPKAVDPAPIPPLPPGITYDMLLRAARLLQSAGYRVIAPH